LYIFSEDYHASRQVQTEHKRLAAALIIACYLEPLFLICILNLVFNLFILVINCACYIAAIHTIA
jgi:hypothetical protein